MPSSDPLYHKPALVFGPLENLSEEDRFLMLEFYNRITEIFEEIFRVRGLVIAERMDPNSMDAFIREQLDKKTSILVFAVTAPLWGCGTIVEIAHRNDVPIIILKHASQGGSALLLGNPSVLITLEFNNFDDGIYQLRRFLQSVVNAESY